MDISTRRKVTRQDMNAARLVFVYVRDAKPKRKVAVPVPEGLTWAEFIYQTKTKLRISGVKEVFLASSGQRVTNLDELQDIDELCVVEGPDSGSSPMNVLSSEANLRSLSIASSSSDAIFKTPEARKLSIHDLRGSALGGSSSSPPGATPEDDEGKYRGRMNPLQRLLKRMLPSIFGAPGLPVTDDARGPDGARAGSFSRRKKGTRKNTRYTVWLMLFLLAVMAVVLLQVLFFRYHRTGLVLNAGQGDAGQGDAVSTGQADQAERERESHR